jgi:4-oxalmesaconate hydratase
MIGAVPGIDPDTGFNFDDTKRYIDQLPLSAEARATLFEGNAKRVYSRLAKQLEKQFA